MIGLSMIYFFFKPMDLKQTQEKEMAQFSLEKFTLSELSQDGLTTKMDGSSAVRYSDRYIVNDIEFTDNSKEFLASMKAKKGLYKGDVVHLEGDVSFQRDDGLRFFSQNVVYNNKKDILYTDVEYIAYIGESYITGTKISFDNNKGTIKSKKIYAVYNLEKEKR